ncbi:hypothetical protein BYT27DRAFT_7093337, partial [Phlegmacium glaucopus]
LTQLHTQHTPLQAYLHKIKRVDTPICQQCQLEPETTAHYLFFCTKFEGHRVRLRRDLKRTRELDASILGEMKSLPAIFKFINAMERFSDSHGDLILQREQMGG